MLETIRKYFHKIAETLEVLMSLAVFAAVILALIALVPAFQEYLHDPSGSEGFMDLLQQILSIVVGLEFISMLCKPDAENVTEVLIFLIARHVIVMDTSAMENLLSVISIGILFFIRYFVIQSGCRPKTLLQAASDKLKGRPSSVLPEPPEEPAEKR